MGTASDCQLLFLYELESEIRWLDSVYNGDFVCLGNHDGKEAGQALQKGNSAFSRRSLPWGAVLFQIFPFYQ